MFRQVESSRQMYHAVMEEVARFLERCYHSLDAFQQNNQIGRSRSVTHVFDQDRSNESATMSSTSTIVPEMRMRSNTNLMEKPTLDFNRKLNDTAMTTDSYKNFSDFTWYVLF